MADKKRIEYLDVMRAIAMLWIVVIWHNSVVNTSIIFFRFITYGVLAVFVFMSAYLTTDVESSKVYYRKKLKKFYPVFAVSCLTLYILHIINSSYVYIESIPQLLLSLTGLSCFTGNMPLTIWFFCMILLFYAITPLLLKNKYKWLIAIVIEIILIIGNLFLTFDERLFAYFPFYVIGLLLKDEYKKYNDISAFIRILIIICGIGCSLITLYNADNVMTLMLSGLFCGLAIIEISKHLAHFKIVTNTARWLAYVSTFSYLFHRQFYVVLGTIGRHFPISTILLKVAMPIAVLCFSYIGQRLYDTYIMKPKIK